MKAAYIACFIVLPSVLLGADTTKSNGKVVNGIERLMYITDKTGVSIYDINDGHKLLRSFDVPDTAAAFERLLDEPEVAVSPRYRTKTSVWRDEIGDGRRD